MNEKIEAFSIAAQQFCEWAESDYPLNSQSLKQALELITELFLLGVRLADEFESVDEDSPSVEAVDDKTRTVYSQASNLPLTYYSEIYNSTVLPPKEPIIGNLADDIADIYRDLRCGLDLLDAGHTKHAVQEWVFHLKYHWGEHATSAMRALYWYLRENEAV